MSSETGIYLSAFKMHCDACDMPIERGEEITPCTKVPGMTLRNSRNVNKKWVHLYCVPCDDVTEHYKFVVEDMKSEYPYETDENIEFMVKNHDYWNFQKKEEDTTCIEIYDTDDPEFPKIIFEPAKSGRSTCVICSEKILKDSPRVGRLNIYNGNYGQYKHLQCWDLEDPTMPCETIDYERIKFEAIVDQTIYMLRNRPVKKLIC